ncbi:hypothetical protein CNR34_00098 [Pseudomonas phage nickie]|uniref:Uncharacterized protein n=1 Tax=Pseudomonas phage nickie TaxID=2048977 RepID=A0A2H4P785_9CAUD|nr:hypothetical protein FDJ16_gp067 [Pseudomonas phage nickie]ATW58031.1 hypothetical protein CNR34_00098 [Pseudomonas phage nickie]
MTDEYSLDDELTRKSGEAALWLDNELRRGGVTRLEAYTALMVFDMITLGLIDPKFNDWSREERDKAMYQRPDKVVMHRFEPDGRETVISVSLNRRAGTVDVTQLTRNPTHESKTHTFDEETDPVTAACAGYLKIIERLQSKGLVVVA